MKHATSPRLATADQPTVAVHRALFVPDSFGGFLSAPAVAALVQARLREQGIHIDVHPMADGGEGTLDALHAHRPGVVERAVVQSPLRRPRSVTWSRLGDGAFIESAEAVGLPRQDGHGAPLTASSVGLGELLIAVARRTPARITVGLGGSATVDGGLGMLQGLGMKVLDARERPLPPGAGASQLAQAERIVGDPPLSIPLVAWCDVRTPLRDCIAQFGPQKGVRPEQIEPLTDDLMRWADLLDAWRLERGLGALDRDIEGGGAAGGLGYALAAVLNAELLAGAPAMAASTDLDRALKDCRVVILGEGRLDATSFEGKVLGDVLDRARAHGAAVAALVGQADAVPAPPEGPDRIFVAGELPDRETALLHAVDALGRWLRHGAPWEEPPIAS